MSEIQIRTNFRKSLFKELKTYLSLIFFPLSNSISFLARAVICCSVIEKILHTFFQSPVLLNTYTGHGGYQWWILENQYGQFVKDGSTTVPYGCATCWLTCQIFGFPPWSPAIDNIAKVSVSIKF